MKTLFTVLVGAIGWLALASSSHAQMITWGLAQNMTGNPDISTTGTYYDAASPYGTLTLSNGAGGVGGTNVTFNALTSAGSGNVSDGTISVTYTDGVGNYGAAFTANSPSSTNYSNLVNTGIFNNGGGDTVTIGGSLVAGDTYQVEVWTYYSGDSSTAATVFSSTGGNSVSLLNQTGQYALGTFVATASPEVFSFTADGGHGFVNDVSVRDITGGSVVPEPSTYALLGLGVFALIMLQKRKSQV